MVRRSNENWLIDARKRRAVVCNRRSRGSEVVKTRPEREIRHSLGCGGHMAWREDIDRDGVGPVGQDACDRASS